MELSQRIAALEHIEAIKTLKYRYWRACDAKDPNGFRASFIASGARIDYGPLGSFDDVEPMVQIFTRIALRQVDGRHVVFDMHHGMHPDITLTGDSTATGRWTLRFRQINLVAGTETVSTSEYFDEYVVEDGQWKMSSCVNRPIWSVTRPLDAAAVIVDSFEEDS